MAEHYVTNELFRQDPFLRHPGNYTKGLFRFDSVDEPDVIRKGKEVHKKLLDSDLMVLWIDKTDEGVEMFGFAGSETKSALPTLLAKDQSLLVSFSKYFREEQQKVLLSMREAKIHLPTLKGDNYFNNVPLPSPLCTQKRTSFLTEIGMGTLVQQAKSLSPQERACLRLHLQFKSAKETGANLGLSPRTVESYFESIKRKLGCSFKSDLFHIAKKMDELGLLRARSA